MDVFQLPSLGLWDNDLLKVIQLAFVPKGGLGTESYLPLVQHRNHYATLSVYLSLSFSYTCKLVFNGTYSQVSVFSHYIYYSAYISFHYLIINHILITLQSKQLLMA